MKLFGNMYIDNNTINIGNYSVNELAKKYKTPLYIIDEEGLIKNIEKYKNNFKSDKFETEVIYASKALLNTYMAKIIKDNNLCIDVVSGGELFTVLKSNFDTSKIYFHGNNKLKEELLLAIKHNIGTIIIDNINEFHLLEKLLAENNIKNQGVMLRVNPGIEAHTHKYIKTTKNDSK
ncbi:MAG: diaminopimelate decarboxylase, partial [Tissierellia bacterium]|nr:diaminopimelate decarboxylase [Tissierellia bacterium]